MFFLCHIYGITDQRLHSCNFLLISPNALVYTGNPVTASQQHLSDNISILSFVIRYLSLYCNIYTDVSVNLYANFCLYVRIFVRALGEHIYRFAVFYLIFDICDYFIDRHIWSVHCNNKDNLIVVSQISS